jgi:hypothetical protein
MTMVMDRIVILRSSLFAKHVMMLKNVTRMITRSANQTDLRFRGLLWNIMAFAQAARLSSTTVSAIHQNTFGN